MADLQALKQRFLTPGRVPELYDVGDVLGKGGFATVRVGRERAGAQRVVAIKIINPKISADPRQQRVILDECATMAKVNAIGNGNLLRFIAAHEDFSTTTQSTRLTIVSELCSGGELFDRIVKVGHYDEAAAARLVGTLATALHALHGARIIHRDIKPENILYASPAADAAPVIADFGLAKHMDAPEPAPALVGTPGYLSPEIISHRLYTPACDVWALGVITYILLCGCVPGGPGGGRTRCRRQAAALSVCVCVCVKCGAPPSSFAPCARRNARARPRALVPCAACPPRWPCLPACLPFRSYPPFYAEDNKLLYQQIAKGGFHFHDEAWSHISESAKDLVRRMLTVDPAARITLAGLLAHPFLAGAVGEPAAAGTAHLPSTLANMKKFNARRKIKAAALATAWLGALRKETTLALAGLLGARVFSDSESSALAAAFRDAAGKAGVIHLEQFKTVRAGLSRVHTLAGTPAGRALV